MLLLVYPDASIAAKIVEDPQTAPIPDLHKAMYAWVKKFVRGSWDMTANDVQILRDAGATDEQIANWAHTACMQTWWVMMGDGAGVTLDFGQEVGPVVGKTRPYYEQAEPGLLAAAPEGLVINHTANGDGWIDTNEENAAYKTAARIAEERYGFVPNLVKALSLSPAILARHQLAFELLERPQSESLSPRHHALVRALTAQMNCSDYFEATITALLEDTIVNSTDTEKIFGPWNPGTWDEADRTIFEFAIKAARNAYKITEKDAQRFHEIGLDDQAYVDVLNTVAIQTSIERLANSLGIAADEKPLLRDEPAIAK